ncbi:MAG: DNA-formamidopyrimidine glycosylase family protein [Actinomycetota bacterium]
MPEGDTIHRTATRLRPALVGRPLVRFAAARWSGPVPDPGETVVRVRSAGKHLFVDFSGGLSLRTHLRMSGRWDLYPTGARWRRAASSARAVIEVPGWVAVCFSAPDVTLSARPNDATAHLGPDLCLAGPDFARIVERAAALGSSGATGVTIGELVMDQRVAAGIGNVYKSETLFLERLDPTTPVGSLPPDRLAAVYRRAHRLLRANLGAGPRRTVPGGLAVNGRAVRACRVCSTLIERIVQGTTLPRSTYWCPTCQASAPAPSPTE